jgi:hypothetical protein
LYTCAVEPSNRPELQPLPIAYLQFGARLEKFLRFLCNYKFQSLPWFVLLRESQPPPADAKGMIRQLMFLTPSPPKSFGVHTVSHATIKWPFLASVVVDQKNPRNNLFAVLKNHGGRSRESM